ncbi:MAG: hypothetical protein QXV17_11535, partial [Candidatus Micrarchaeaceae archaeon]
NRESMMTETMREMEDLRRYRTKSIEKDLKERKKYKAKLDNEIGELEEIKEKLEEDVSMLEKRRERLSMETASNIMKWYIIIKSTGGQLTNNDILASLLPDYLKNLEPIIQLPEPKSEVLIVPYDTNENEEKHTTKIIGHMLGTNNYITETFKT